MAPENFYAWCSTREIGLDSKMKKGVKMKKGSGFEKGKM